MRIKRKKIIINQTLQHSFKKSNSYINLNKLGYNHLTIHNHHCPIQTNKYKTNSMLWLTSHGHP